MKINQNKTVKYYLNKDGAFVIENYNHSKPFANFFPGIAGKYGIPMWAFYVNRAQCISSFGTRDKDHAILEFFPANKSWQLVSTYGYRTFIKLKSNRQNILYEPFHNGFVNLGFKISNKMSLTSYNLKIEEDNSSLGIQTKVEYFTIPQDSYAGLVRTVTIKNTSRQRKNLQLIDGLPQIVPFGTANLFLKKLGRTIEAWMNVGNLENGVPFYKLDVDPADRPEVIHITEGNFYLAFHYQKGKPSILKPIVDPQSVFGEITDFSCPVKFIAAADFKAPAKEITTSRMPSALILLNLTLAPGEEKTFHAVAGYMRNLQALNTSIPKIIAPGYLAKKDTENLLLIDNLERDIETKSSCPEFNLYAKQTYLDNILRGGYPLILKPGKAFYLYSRKHGDLERDYNKFHLEASYFSQGNGNYRDINQNRRCDIWFNPDILDENIIDFFNLLQADGFNPLVIKGASFTLTDTDGLNNALKALADPAGIKKIIAFLHKPFTPGDIILFIEENSIRLKVSYDEFLNILISHCEKNHEAEHGEGFWIDHWTYNLDLLENYLSVYPEKFKEIVFDKKIFTYFDNSETVKPRHEKYLLHAGTVKQLHSLAIDSTKKEMIHKRGRLPHVLRADYGQGEIYQTTLINKILCLMANKLASLDPSGVGIEMEANKPDWYDALNGLPGLFGSSLNETLELKRLVLFIKEALKKTGIQQIAVTEEIHEFLTVLNNLLREAINDSSPDRDFRYWDKSYSLKEEYRHKTQLGFKGTEKELSSDELSELAENALKKINQGISKAKDNKNDIYYSYFINEVTAYKKLNSPFVQPTKFSQKMLPLFLEGQMHALRIAENAQEAKSLHDATKKSELFDKALKMYKITASLKSMPEEIGRCRVFTPGWLEHESIWLHMEYKYLLETLKQGLYEEFYADFKNVLVPFQNPQRYGRSILENSSFIVSSAFPDKSLHGNGYVARLSGSTAEFLQIWLTMNIGKAPFCLNSKGELNLTFAPILADWLFDSKDRTYTFTFLSKIRVTYHNHKNKNTFGKNSCSPCRITFNDKNNKSVELTSDTIPAPYAEQVRSRLITGIDIFLA